MGSTKSPGSPPDSNEQIARKRLPIYTFLAVFFAIAATGFVVVPFILQGIEKRYILLQADVNARQARALALFVEDRDRQGVSRENILHEVQAMLANSEADRGYSCVVSQSSKKFLSHPMEAVIGMSVSEKDAEFEDWLGKTPREKWERFIEKGVNGGGLLYLPDDQSEVISMYSVPAFGWTITTHENTARVREELASLRFSLIAFSVLLGVVLAIPTSIAARRVSRRYEAKIEDKNELLRVEREKSERLLLNILPEKIAEELKSGKTTIAERHMEVTILFADIVGFTPLARTMDAEDLVMVLNRIFSRYDDLAESYRLEKIKTIGDAYMVCGGLPEPSPGSAARVADIALEMVQALDSINREFGLDLKVRIGINTGEVVAGVIGKQKFIYDLWGDAVNTASRMESSGAPNAIQVTQATYDLLEGEYVFESLGVIEVKGIGSIAAYFLKRKKDSSPVTGKRADSR